MKTCLFITYCSLLKLVLKILQSSAVSFPCSGTNRQNGMTTEMVILGEQDLGRFKFSMRFGPIAYIATTPGDVVYISCFQLLAQSKDMWPHKICMKSNGQGHVIDWFGFLYQSTWCSLTHWGRDKMDAISQTTFSCAFSSMKIAVFWLNFHWNILGRV